jgi:hypothetical protein
VSATADDKRRPDDGPSCKAVSGGDLAHMIVSGAFSEVEARARAVVSAQRGNMDDFADFRSGAGFVQFTRSAGVHDVEAVGACFGEDASRVHHGVHIGELAHPDGGGIGREVAAQKFE